MKSLLAAILGVILMAHLSNARPLPEAAGLLVRAELDPSIFRAAKTLAAEQNLPVSLQLPTGEIIYATCIEQEKVVYVVITNPLHPFEGCYSAFYDDLERQFDLSKATKRFAAIRPSSSGRQVPANTRLLLVPDWTSDRVCAFDPTTGNLVDSMFIPPNATALASPKQALEHPVHKFITVSDQITDLVQKFNPQGGTWMSWFAPATGINTAILDNIRGHAYRPNNNLLVTVASGANQNSIAEFDTAGSYLGNFVAQASGGLNSPFDILIRQSDILISQSSSPTGVKRYDLSGTYLSQWTTITSFPQQMCRLADGRIAVANFSGSGNTGIRLYDANGNFLRLLAGVTGNRGVYQLPSGNFLTTNATGLHEIDSTTGNLVRTIHGGTNFQYINLYDPISVGVGEIPASVPEQFALDQNYPNPFNPGTAIRYALANAAFVTFTIFNTLGQEIIRLREGEQSAGNQSVKWDGLSASGNPVAAGVYFYRIDARPTDGSSPFVSTRKMMLLK